MTTQRGHRAAQLITPDNASETIFNLAGLLIEAKQNGSFDEDTYDEINERHIEPFKKLAGAITSAKVSIDAHKAEANKYEKLSRYLAGHITGDDSLEKNRALFSLLIGEMVALYPSDVNLRALHTNLMSEKPGTHKPVYKIAELGPLVSHAISRGAYQLCAEHQNVATRKAEAAQETVIRKMAEFNRHFDAMQTIVMREINAANEKREAAMLAEAHLVINEQIQEIKTIFGRLMSADGQDAKQLIQYSNLDRNIKLQLNQNLDQFAAALKNQDEAAAATSAKSIVNICKNIRMTGAYLLLKGLRGYFEYFQEIFDQKSKLENNTLKPVDVLKGNIAEKANSLKQSVKESLKFFEQYAAENKNAKFSSYTANKGNLAEKFGVLMKKIQDKIDNHLYKNKHDVDHDIQAIDKLRHEYDTILETGRNSALIFKPKGTGKFATHVNTQMINLRKELEDLKLALQHSNKFKK